MQQQEPLFVEVAPDFYEFRGNTFEDHVDSWQIVDEQVQKDKWKLSAVAASLDTKYNDKTVDRFAHETRRSARRVREYAQTWRAFQNGARAPILSFSHHVKAASAPDPVLAIQKAHDGEWSVHDLEKWIRTGIEPSQKKEKKQPDLQPNVAMQKLHDKMVFEEIDRRLVDVKGWTEPVDPLLTTVYHRIEEILEWQKGRTLARDCAAIIKLFSGDVGTEAPERASDADIAAWLYGHGYIMSKQQLGNAGNPDPDNYIEPSGRLGLMLKLKILVVKSREDSRQDGRKGAIPAVYAVERDYMEWLDNLSDSTGLERAEAMKKDWAQRIARYAPELVEKTEGQEKSQAA